MKGRCRNPNKAQWMDYGGRGIKVCARWERFENFLADMGEPKPRMTLERIDNDGDYEPDNCRWATRKEQVRNRRVTKLIRHDGETKPLAEWAEDIGITYGTLETRLRRGWSVERALTAPLIAERTHCDRGHRLDEANTYSRPDAKNRQRLCRKCQRLRALRYRVQRTTSE